MVGRQDFWSETSVQTLKALALSGLSASQIGARMSRTRNAIIGKAGRESIQLGHKRKGDPSATPVVRQRVVRPRSTMPPKPKRERYKYQDGQAPERQQRFHPPGWPPLELSKVVDKHYEAPASTRKTFLELGPGHCRWPCGHPGEDSFFFCGDTQVKDRPYCAGHCSIAYQRTARQQAQYADEVAA